MHKFDNVTSACYASSAYDMLKLYYTLCDMAVIWLIQLVEDLPALHTLCFCVLLLGRPS